MKEPLIPPFRFSYVEPELFRGAYPVKKNFSFLKKLKLKTIISLRPNERDDDLQEFCKAENIVNYVYNVPKYVGQIILTNSMISEILVIISDPSNLPLYLHCMNGSHNAGIVFMCLRKLQMWSQKSILSEFSLFVNSVDRIEEDFISSFSTTLELHRERPQWLQHLKGNDSHPSYRVFFTDESDSDDEEYNIV